MVQSPLSLLIRTDLERVRCILWALPRDIGFAQFGTRHNLPEVACRFTSARGSVLYMQYNFCRIHKTLRITSAMAAGVTDRLWSVGDIVKVLEDWESSTE
jgi:hypothetical protein